MHFKWSKLELHFKIYFVNIVGCNVKHFHCHLSGSIMFHVRRRPADSQPRRRKKKPLGVSNGGNNVSTDREGPILVEITHSGEGGRSVKLTAEPIEVSVCPMSICLSFRLCCLNHNIIAYCPINHHLSHILLAMLLDRMIFDSWFSVSFLQNGTFI